MDIRYTTGYAGTGKSTALLNKVNSLKNLEETVVLCPTHKAAERLIPKLPSSIYVTTMHSILGWIPSINEDATKIGHIDIITKIDKPITEYTHYIIDEGGMLSEDMFMELISKIEDANNFETDNIIIDVYLDPYQLLPVKGRQMQIDPDFETKLLIQYRAESPDLVETFTKFVRFLEGINKNDLTIQESENVKFIDRQEAIKLFDINTDRLLAYTNETVGWYNKEIALYNGIASYEYQEVQLGSMPDLYKVEAIYDLDIEHTKYLIELFEEKRLWLQNSKVSNKYKELEFMSLLKLGKRGLRFIDVNNLVIPVIPGIYNANILNKEIKAKAIEDKKNFKYVYALNKAFTMDYRFASTVHKAQGSEYDVVFIDKKDIMKSILNNYYDTYARLMYVALSRAKKKVYIIQ